MKKNKNREFQQLGLWYDAIEFYSLDYLWFRHFQFALNLENNAWKNPLIVKESK